MAFFFLNFGAVCVCVDAAAAAHIDPQFDFLFTTAPRPHHWTSEACRPTGPLEEMSFGLARRSVGGGSVVSRGGAALHNEATALDGPPNEETNGGVCRQTGTELTEGQHTHLSESGGLNICTPQPQTAVAEQRPETNARVQRTNETSISKKQRRGHTNQRAGAQGLEPLLL